MTEVTKTHELAAAPAVNMTLEYVRDCKNELKVFLNDPSAPIDTNHLEHALRLIPAEPNARTILWPWLGAWQIVIVQSPIINCRLPRIDVYTYLIDDLDAAN